VDVDVLTVEKITDVLVTVWPLSEVVAIEVPCRSIKTVEVETGSVVVLEMIFVAWKVVVKVAPGKMEDLMIDGAYVSVSVDFAPNFVVMDEVLKNVVTVLVD
jgi:hypothetical protein